MIKNVISGHWESLCTSCCVDILHLGKTKKENFVKLHTNLKQNFVKFILIFLLFSIILVEIVEANVAGTKENLAMLVKNFSFIPSKMAVLIFPTPNGEKFHLMLRILSRNSW